MAKMGKRIYSDWLIGTHAVNSYKARVTDPAVRRERRSSNDIRKVLARALNKVKGEPKDVDIRSEEYKGKEKIRQMYKVNIFKSDYYILASGNVVITLFTPEMVGNDANRGGLTFPGDDPFEDLQSYYSQHQGKMSLRDKNLSLKS